MAFNGVWLITRNSAIKGIIKGINCTTKKCQGEFVRVRACKVLYEGMTCKVFTNVNRLPLVICYR